MVSSMNECCKAVKLRSSYSRLNEVRALVPSDAPIYDSTVTTVIKDYIFPLLERMDVSK